MTDKTTERLLAAVRKRAGTAETSEAARDEAIRAARTAGIPLRAIAEAAGMNHPRVMRICDRS